MSSPTEGSGTAQRSIASPDFARPQTIGISNAAELSDHGHTELRALALRVAAAGLGACDVGRATEETVARTADGIAVAGRAYPLADGARVLVVGSGKATLMIAAALERVLGERVDAGAVVVRDGAEAIALKRIEVLVADHPLPTERSAQAAGSLLSLAESAREGDLVLASFTGGSSALASLPPDGVSVAEKRLLHELLLASGAPITDVNTVRKHVSRIKGGRLAQRAAPARLVNLTASDVAGDVLDAITDPSVQDSSETADAIAVLKARGLWGQVPSSVRAHLESTEADSPRLDIEPQTALLVTGASACRAMVLEAQAAGCEAEILSTALEGEATALGGKLAAAALERGAGTAPGNQPVVLVGCGGEATVALGADGAFGHGGPNQELALAASLALDGAPVCACFLDTDGSDGGTEVAGAIVDGHSGARARDAGVDLEAALAEHRSGVAAATLGDQIVTGPTQTNVNDLFVIAIGAPGDA